MKKWISTLLVVSLVTGMAAMLHACGKPKDAPETTTLSEETTSFYEEDATESSNEWEDLFEDLEDVSYTERTTDEHYEEEYEALTLPKVVPTQAAAGTTRAQTTTNPAIRETTTQFQFTSPSRASTTKPSAGTTASSGSTTTTKPSTTAAQQPAEQETTMLADYVGNAGGVQDVTVMPRPQVTYLDKYVIDIFKSGAFTLETETKEEGMTMPLVFYTDGNNSAIEMSVTQMMMQNLELPSAVSSLGKVRIIAKNTKSSNPKAYIAWTGGYMEMDDVAEMAGMMDELQNDQNMSALLQDGLDYCGKTTGVGYVCETYINPEENMQYNFYFGQTTDGYEGILRWDRVDLDTKQTDSQIVMRLTRGVTNKKAFDVSGKKTSIEEFTNMFG